MAASLVAAAVLIVGGAVLAVYAWRGVRSRPGWDSPYSLGAILLYLGLFLVLGGIVNIILALRR